MLIVMLAAVGCNSNPTPPDNATNPLGPSPSGGATGGKKGAQMPPSGKDGLPGV